MKRSIHDKAIYITGNKKKQKKQALFKKPALAACLWFLPARSQAPAWECKQLI